MKSIVVILFILLAACGETQNTIAPVEEWPAIGTREAAESTRVATQPVTAPSGEAIVYVDVRNPADALWKVKAALAQHAGYEKIHIVALSGPSPILSALYESSRTQGIAWGQDWEPTVRSLQFAATTWEADARFWGDTP